MKREIIIGKEFCSYISTPLVADDVTAYKLVWSPDIEGKAFSLLINAKRSDGVIVTDCVTVSAGEKAEYTLAGNMYCVPGSLEIRVSVSDEGSILTERILHFEVIEGNGNEAIESENNTLVISTLLNKTAEIADKVSDIPEKLSQLENDCGFISEITSDDIPDSSITGEKTTFYKELMSLISSEHEKNVVWKNKVVVSDKIKGLPAERVEINGITFCNDNILVKNDVVLSTLDVEYKTDKYGNTVINGILHANESVTLLIPDVKLYAGNTYYMKTEAYDDRYKDNIRFYAEDFEDGTLDEDMEIKTMTIVNEGEEMVLENAVFRFGIYEETYSGKHTYPVFNCENPKISISGKNLITYSDIYDSNYCKVENKGKGEYFDGRYYASLSLDFAARLERGKAYTFSCKRKYLEGSSSSTTPRIAFIYDDGTTTQWTYSNPTAILEDKEVVNANLFISGPANVKCEITDLMFEEGTEVTEYEEYIPKSEFVVSCGKLYGINGVCDKLVIGNGIYVERQTDGSLIDETADLSQLNLKSTFFPEIETYSDEKILDKYKNKTLIVSVDADVTTENRIIYPSV